MDFRNRLVVISACGRSLSYNGGGNSGVVPTSILRKCALKFRIVTSAAFLWCVPGGTGSSCNLYFSCIVVFGVSDNSFSSMCFLGIIPACHSLNIIVLYARRSSLSFRLLMVLTSIVLLSISTITMIYLLPNCDRVGNCPIWSEKIVLPTSYSLVYMSRSLCPWSVAVLGTLKGARLGLVDLKFLLIGSDGLLASRWYLGNIWRRCIRLASAILRSYPI